MLVGAGRPAVILNVVCAALTSDPSSRPSAKQLLDLFEGEGAGGERCERWEGSWEGLLGGELGGKLGGRGRRNEVYKERGRDKDTHV